jgi:hypothetical protein
LVSARPEPPSPSSQNINKIIQSPSQNANPKQQQQQQQEQEEDPDLQRAKDLVQLHYSVKVAHADGAVDEGLVEARRAVKEVLHELEDESSNEYWT